MILIFSSEEALPEEISALLIALLFLYWVFKKSPSSNKRDKNDSFIITSDDLWHSKNYFSDDEDYDGDDGDDGD